MEDAYMVGIIPEHYRNLGVTEVDLLAKGITFDTSGLSAVAKAINAHKIRTLSDELQRREKERRLAEIKREGMKLEEAQRMLDSDQKIESLFKRLMEEPWRVVYFMRIGKSDMVIGYVAFEHEQNDVAYDSCRVQLDSTASPTLQLGVTNRSGEDLAVQQEIFTDDQFDQLFARFSLNQLAYFYNDGETAKPN